MLPEQITGLAPALTGFLGVFKNCFGECRLLDHFATYCRGLLSDLQRKSVEPIALAAGSTVRALQLFLTDRVWDHLRLRDRVQQRIAAQHAPAPGSARVPDDLGVIGLIDETSVAKKGDQTPGVQRQWCGSLGKVENCVVTVHLGYAHGTFKTLLDGELYLPQSWEKDRQRCRRAGIPDDLPYRPKTAIAVAEVRRALGNGLRFDEPPLAFPERLVAPFVLGDCQRRPGLLLGNSGFRECVGRLELGCLDRGESLLECLLLFGEAFELFANVRALLFVAGLLEGGLQFTDALIQILLALGEFLEPVGHLQLLLLLRGLAVLIRVGLALGLVRVVLLREVQLVQLRLHALAAALLLAALAALPARHLELARGELEHRLISRLFRRQRGGQGSE